MTYEEYLTAWSALHGGYDPRQSSRVVRGWLAVSYRLGAWLGAHGVRPGAVTAFGLLLCLLVPAVVLLGSWGLLLGAILVLLAAVVDGLDGAVAVITDRVTRLGYVYDSVADRLGELAWLVALWLAGAPGWLAAAAGAAAWLHEYLRARAATAASPASDIGVVTVGERPTRVSLASSGLLVAALSHLLSTAWTAPILTVTAAAWLALSVIGFGHLSVVLRRDLTS